MNHKFVTAVLVALFLAGYIFVLPSYEGARKVVKKEEVKGITLPPAIVNLFALEYRSIAADLLFVRVSQFYGGRVESMKKATQEDWDWLYRNLDLVTELDPYFQDPYFMGNGFLTWDAGMYSEAEALLQKAIDARPWDWNFPFFMGFNKFFFMGDNKAGADYLLMAFKRGGWNFLPSLAARLYYEDKRTETAIFFLRKILESEEDVNAKRAYKTRLDALNKILFLEKAIKFYEAKIGAPPASLETLLKMRIIKEIPADPYGGTFYLDKNGKVRSTSKLARKRKKK